MKWLLVGAEGSNVVWGGLAGPSETGDLALSGTGGQEWQDSKQDGSEGLAT